MQRQGGDTTELASAGLGLNGRFGHHFSLRAAYGWTLNKGSALLGASLWSRSHQRVGAVLAGFQLAKRRAAWRLAV